MRTGAPQKRLRVVTPANSGVSSSSRIRQRFIDCRPGFSRGEKLKEVQPARNPSGREARLSRAAWYSSAEL